MDGVHRYSKRQQEICILQASSVLLRIYLFIFSNNSLQLDIAGGPAFFFFFWISFPVHACHFLLGRGGVRFEDGVSLQTPVVAWGDSGGLRIESATRELRVEGPRRVSIESSEARVILEANQNLTFTSSQGKVLPTKITWYRSERSLFQRLIKRQILYISYIEFYEIVKAYV